MTFYLGIDGGGTQTTALLTDEQGQELARVTGAAGIINPLEPEAGARSLSDLARRVLVQARVDARPKALVCALAGAGREAERSRLERSLAAQDIAESVHVVGDFEAAIQDAFNGGPGILVVAGTGSSAFARSVDGRTARAGGWGHILGDEGSSYALGLAALRNCMRAHDGRAADARWVQLVLGRTHVAEPEALVRWAAEASKADIAALAPAVFEASRMRVTGASAIIEEAATELARHVGALYERLKPWPAQPAIAFTGGLLAPGRPLREEAIRQTEHLALRLPVIDKAIDAARGAAALARRGS